MKTRSGRKRTAKARKRGGSLEPALALAGRLPKPAEAGLAWPRTPRPLRRDPPERESGTLEPRC